MRGTTKADAHVTRAAVDVTVGHDEKQRGCNAAPPTTAALTIGPVEEATEEERNERVRSWLHESWQRLRRP